MNARRKCAHCRAPLGPLTVAPCGHICYVCSDCSCQYTIQGRLLCPSLFCPEAWRPRVYA